MAATTSVPHSQDIPFSVQGYVTDPKLVGYQILTNYESMYWAPLVSSDAWRLYEVLRSFCHEGNNTCHPSVRLLAAILGLKEKRVLTGWAKTVQGKVYQYPGLIEALQEYKLVIAEVKGEGPKMRYVFHVNMTPGLLTDDQLFQLPQILRKKHTELIERCENTQQVLEAKRRPSKFQNGGQSIDQKALPEGGGKLPPRGGNLPGGGGNLPPEQHPSNNTHRTSDSVHVDHNNNSGGDSDPKTDVVVVVALIDQGISEGVAKRLARRYSRKRVEEKISFLAFLVDERPEEVKKPAAWLRRAIEENYGAPDGFLSKEERERLAAEEAQRAEEEQRQTEAAEERNRAFQEENKSERAATIRRLREEYNTTAEDLTFWEQTQLEIQYTATPEITSLVAELEILRIRDGTVVLGAWSEAAWRRLQHPGTAKILSRALSQVAGRSMEIQSVEIQNYAQNQSKSPDIVTS